MLGRRRSFSRGNKKPAKAPAARRGPLLGAMPPPNASRVPGNKSSNQAVALAQAKRAAANKAAARKNRPSANSPLSKLPGVGIARTVASGRSKPKGR